MDDKHGHLIIENSYSSEHNTCSLSDKSYHEGDAVGYDYQVVIEEEDETKIYESVLWKRSLSQFGSSIALSKDSMVFENDQVYFAKEIDFNWLSKTISNIGRIEWIRDYEDLVNGDNFETYQLILITINAIEELNTKLEEYIKESFVISSSKLVPTNWLKITGSDTEFVRSEIVRLLKLVVINSEVEQPERILMLIFLLRFALENEKVDLFSTIVKFLYHLSELRRFNDSLLSTLDDIKYFGTHDSEIIFDAIVSDFFRDAVSKRVQLQYIGFLSNIWWTSRRRVNEKFNQYFDHLWMRLISAIDWENLVNTQEKSQSIMMSSMISSFKSKSYEQDDSFLKRMPIDCDFTSMKYIMIPFISLVKLWGEKSKFKNMVQNYSIVERIYCNSDFKNSLMGSEDCSKSFSDLETCLVKTFKKYNKKFKELDEIAWVTDLNLDKYFKRSNGYTIKHLTGSNSRATENEPYGLSEGSESEKTNLRETQTTLNFSRCRMENMNKNSYDFSLIMNYESRLGTEGNQSSIHTHNINSLKKGSKRHQIGNSSWKPWCTIF